MIYIAITCAVVVVAGVAYLAWQAWNAEKARQRVLDQERRRLDAMQQQLLNIPKRHSQNLSLPTAGGFVDKHSRVTPVPKLPFGPISRTTPSTLPPPSPQAVPRKFAKPKQVLPPVPPPNYEDDEPTSFYKPGDEGFVALRMIEKAIESSPPLPDPPRDQHVQKHFEGHGGHSGGGGASFHDPQPWPSAHTHVDYGHHDTSHHDSSPVSDSTSFTSDPPSGNND